MAGMMSRLLGDWDSAAEAYGAAAADDGGEELPDMLKMWLKVQLDEIQALKQQRRQQQQQQNYHKWQRSRSMSRVTAPGGDSGIYISIVMVGRHDNTQVRWIS